MNWGVRDRAPIYLESGGPERGGDLRMCLGRGRKYSFSGNFSLSEAILSPRF